MRWLALCVTLLVAACATVPASTVPVAELQRFRLVDVRVEGAEVIRSWPAEEAVIAGTLPPEIRSRLDVEPASNFPQVTAHFQAALTTRLRAELGARAGDVFVGQRPVRAVMRVKSFDVPSGGRRIFVDSTAKLQADIDLVDAQTGALILRYEGPWLSRRLIGGIYTGIAIALERSDVGAELVGEYVNAYRNWLVGA